MKKTIIWDWNGTLIDDVDICVDIINTMMVKRNMPAISRNRYREIFTFPVINYYISLGFEFESESFQEVAIEYTSAFFKKSRSAKLHDSATSVLEHFSEMNYRQIIISAMEKTELLRQVKSNDVFHHFQAILGLDNIHGGSKTQNAMDYFSDNGHMNSEDLIFIGDTFHDYEVAKAIGCRCILINNGHQELSNFNFDKEVTILDTISDLLDIIQI